MLSKSIDLVTIHDIARPFVTNDLILSTIFGCNENDGCIAAVSSKDTVKEVNNFNIVRTIDRKKIWLAQTPQTFKKNLLAILIIQMKLPWLKLMVEPFQL